MVGWGGGGVDENEPGGKTRFLETHHIENMKVQIHNSSEQLLEYPLCKRV